MKTVLRFLATGDMQVHAWKQFSYTMPSGMNSRLHYCLKVFDILKEEAEKRGIDKVLLNGDLFEENAYINVEVYDAVYRKLEKLHKAGLDTTINLGNHDLLLQSGRRTMHSLRPFRKVARIIEEPTLVWDHVSIIPYNSDPKHIKDAIRRSSTGSKHALVLHCGVQGAKTGPTAYLVRNPIKLADLRKDHFSLVLLSDFHTQQRLAKNVFYLGSPLQHTFGETHDPCVWDISILGESPWFISKRIYTNLPQFKKVRISTLKDLREKERSLLGNYVQVILASGSKVADQDLEEYAKGKFQVQVLHAQEHYENESKSVHTLAPEEAIEKFVQGQGIKSQRLVQLGYKLYRGEV